MAVKSGQYNAVCQLTGDILVTIFGEPDEVIPQLRSVQSKNGYGIAIQNRYGLIVEEIPDPETRRGKSAKYW